MDFNQDAPESSVARTSVKRQAIVAAATQAFLESGYGSASMESIAQAAGVSKQTVYNHFPNKETLFVEVVGAECRVFLDAFAGTEPAGNNPRDVLLGIGRAMMRIVLTPKSMDLYRIMVAAAPQFAGLGKAFFEMGPRKAVRRLAVYLERETQAGKLTVRDSERAAEHFFGMLTSNIQMRALFGVLEGEAAPERVEGRIAAAVETFLRAYAVRD